MFRTLLCCLLFSVLCCVPPTRTLACENDNDCRAGTACVVGRCEDAGVVVRDAGSGPRDSGPDAGIDSGPVDGSPVDGGPVDGGLVDGGLVDGGLVDGGLVDGGLVDGGPQDAGRDGGLDDAGVQPRSLVGTLTFAGFTGPWTARVQLPEEYNPNTVQFLIGGFPRRASVGDRSVAGMNHFFVEVPALSGDTITIDVEPTGGSRVSPANLFSNFDVVMSFADNLDNFGDESFTALPLNGSFDAERGIRGLDVAANQVITLPGIDVLQNVADALVGGAFVMKGAPTGESRLMRLECGGSTRAQIVLQDDRLRFGFGAPNLEEANPSTNFDLTEPLVFFARARVNTDQIVTRTGHGVANNSFSVSFEDSTFGGESCDILFGPAPVDFVVDEIRIKSVLHPNDKTRAEAETLVPGFFQ